MKNMVKLLFLFGCLFLLPGCVIGNNWTEIRGQVKGIGIKEVTLFSVADGSVQVCATVQVGRDSSFGFLVRPEYEGFYMIGTVGLHYPVYLKAGDRVNVELSGKNLGFTGKNTPENKKLAEWEKLAEAVRQKSNFITGRRSIYKDFFPDLEQLAKELPAFRAGIKTSNKTFNEALKRKVGCDMDFYALNFMYTPRMAHAKPEERAEYYKSIVSPVKFADDFVMVLPYGKSYMRLYVMFGTMNGAKGGALDGGLKLLGTDRQKGEYVLELAARFKSYQEYADMVEQYGKYFVTPSLKARADEIGRKLFNAAPTGEAIDFTYPDMNGKATSLSDFKGKVVVVDVWATWCGPCKQQIPYMKALEKEMHGKDVVFLSVSVDKKKDWEKWKKMVKDEELGGVHLFADGFSKITKDYNINGIPRFMVFSKAGKAVSIDAPRPSQPALKRMIEVELKK